MIRIHTFTDEGGHTTNEDVCLVRHSPDDPERVLVCLADGQGGRAGGAKAAQLACATAALASLTAGSCVEALTRADAAVAADPEAGFTTLLGFEVRGDTLTGASCGDSAVLAVCGSGELIEATARQFKNPPVGSGEATLIPFTLRLVRPWRILAMTDGVWKYVGWSRVHELAKTLAGEDLSAALQAAARLPRSGQFQDDFTLVLVEAVD